MKQTIFLIFLLLLLVGCKRTILLDLDGAENDRAYGEMTGRHIVNTSILASNTYYNITGLSAGHLLNINYSNSKLIITNNGTYSVDAQFSFSDGANTEFHLALGVNGLRNEHCHTERKIGTGGDVGSASFTCIDQFNNTDEITIMIENVDSTNDPEIHSINLNMVKI